MDNENIVKLRFFCKKEVNKFLHELSIKPDKKWIKGEKSLGTVGYKYQFDGFEIGSGLLNNCEINDHIDIICKKMNPIIDIVKNHKNIIKIELSIFSYFNDLRVGIHIDNKHIEFLKNLGAEIDIDIYRLN